MIIEIKIPSPGESITEVEIAQWLVADGEQVEKDQEIAEIESEKATLTLVASESGKIEIIQAAGSTVAVGEIACTIDSEQEGIKNIDKKEEAVVENKTKQEVREHTNIKLKCYTISKKYAFKK